METPHRGLPYYLVGGSEEHFRHVIPVVVSRAQEIVLEAIRAVLPAKNPLIWVPLEEVRRNLTALVKEARTTGVTVVSLSRLYYPDADSFIECNRIVTKEGVPLGIGHRPGNKPLPEQIAELRQRCPGPLILVDDMLFHGESLSNLITLGLDNAVALAVSFATASGIRKVREMGLEVVVSMELGDLLDMMPLHDFLPPLPLCGKVVGERPEGSCAHPISRDGLSISIPYIMPFITATQVNQWASIPKEHAFAFSAICLEQAITIFAGLAKVGFLSTMEDLIPLPTRASHPLWVTIDPRQTIVDFLRGVLSSLFAKGEINFKEDVA